MSKFKHYAALLTLAMIMTLTITLAAGCQNKPISLLTVLNPNEFSTVSNNSVIHQAQADEPEDCLLYVINEPTDEELADLLSYTMIKQDSDAPITLLAPSEQNSLLKIYNLVYNEETEAYERDTEIWGLDSTSKGFIAAAQLNYGEFAQPTYEVYIESGESYGSYFFQLPEEPDTLPHIDYLVKQGTVITVRGLD